MNRFEDELRHALRRQPPPPGFAERVLAGASQPKSRWSLAGLSGVRRMQWAVAGVLALIMVGAGIEYQHQRRERARGEAARTQLLLALRITGSKLQFAQQKLQQLQAAEITTETRSRERTQ